MEYKFPDVLDEGMCVRCGHPVSLVKNAEQWGYIDDFVVIYVWVHGDAHGNVDCSFDGCECDWPAAGD